MLHEPSRGDGKRPIIAGSCGDVRWSVGARVSGALTSDTGRTWRRGIPRGQGRTLVGTRTRSRSRTMDRQTRIGSPKRMGINTLPRQRWNQRWRHWLNGGCHKGRWTKMSHETSCVAIMQSSCKRLGLLICSIQNTRDMH
jgi:hypothetical protein